VAKKNTLLYLDENLVSLAKKYELNMSEVTEAAIRSRLYPILSQGEQALDFPQYLDDLKKQSRCYLVPQTINSVMIENVGPLEKVVLRFAKGLNVVVGSNGSGKTALVKTLAYAFGVTDFEKPQYSLTLEKDTGTTRIRPYPEEIRISFRRDNIGTTISRRNTCVLLDEPVAVLAKEGKQKFLKWVKEEFDQAIIVTHEDLGELCGVKALFLTNH
jgi:ABC-type lipoprotein export system ATPase subunit